jgi:hypothetical protein
MAGRGRPTLRLGAPLLAAPLLLATLVGCGARDQVDSDAGTTLLPTSPLTTVAAVERVQFRPVLEVAQARGPCQPEARPAADQQLTLPRCQGDDVVERVVVGPAFLLGDAVESVVPRLVPGEWTVELTFREGAPGIDTFNDWATRCYEVRPECPDTGFGRGAIAIVFDGEVLSAPTVQAPSFARDQIRVSLDDEATAQALAQALQPATP